MKHWEFTSRAYLGTLPRLIDDMGVVKSEIGHFSVGSQHHDVQDCPRFRSRFVITYAHPYSIPPKWISEINSAGRGRRPRAQLRRGRHRPLRVPGQLQEVLLLRRHRHTEPRALLRQLALQVWHSLPEPESISRCHTHFRSAPKQYCDFPENVECGDRPLCDENDANCEERESPELPNDFSKSDQIVSDHVTTYAPLVPCPVDCPPDLVNVELEPCSSEYCTCTNGIGYLVVRKHNAITRH